MKKSEKYFPQLVVGLSSLDEHAQWVHISQAKTDDVYYCPCCKGEIRPRAIKEGESYKMQPHFYHFSGGCSEETYVHFICKTFLFEQGCRFIVDNIEYEVLNVEVEKILSTSFGNYKPDIIVTTTCGKAFYFEIRSTNKKTEHYIPKWDELGNDVVEVNISDCVNQRFSSGIPVFNLIYSDGECFIKTYTHKDYDEVIVKRKMHWKRQDVLDYKIQWERLDWFWTELQNYATGNSSEDNVMVYFNQMEYDDKLWCYENIKKKWCIDLKDKFRDNINQHFFDCVNSYKNDEFDLELKHVSPKVYEIHGKKIFNYLDYELFIKMNTIRVKIGRGGILSLNSEELANNVADFIKDINTYKNHIIKLDKIKSLPYVKSVVPESHWYAKTKSLYSLYFVVTYKIDEKYNNICNIHIWDKYSSRLSWMTTKKIEEEYNQIINRLELKYKAKCFDNYLTINPICKQKINKIENTCKENNFSFYVSNAYTCDDDGIAFVKLHARYDDESVELIIYNNDSLEDNINEFEKLLIKKIDDINKKRNILKEYVDKINSCKNHIWEAELRKLHITLYLIYDSTYINRICRFDDCLDIENKIKNTMIDLLEYAENCKGIRFLEAN